MTNMNKLKGKIVECGSNPALLAQKLGINRATLYRKIKSKGDHFTIGEANLMAEELNLTLFEVNGIFFNLPISDKRQND